MGTLDHLTWFVVFNGIADRWLWGFNADGWQLFYGDPAMGSLGVLPLDGRAPATMEDARWLADVFAFDHDAPVGISPAWEGIWPQQTPKDPAARSVIEPVNPFAEPTINWYWDNLNLSFGAAAELRFNAASYVIRYDGEDGAPSTAFSARFAGREQMVALYAMAARQADPLAEYLCLYRVVEAADRENGKKFSAANLAGLVYQDFGYLGVIPEALGHTEPVNAFEVYKERSLAELDRLAAKGVDDVPGHLYSIRNSIAHGRHGVLADRHQVRSVEAAHALPILKLLARLAVEPPC